VYPGASTTNARVSSVSRVAKRPRLWRRATSDAARFCVVRSSFHLEITFLGAEGKRFDLRGPGATNKEYLPAAQQVRLNVRVTASVMPDEPGVSSAGVPFGPTRSIETFASTPHGALRSAVYPGASTTNARGCTDPNRN
jgi:hypothetical protein